MNFGQLLHEQLTRSAAQAGFVFARAGVHVMGALNVAVAYRRAFQMSRDFRRLPA